jgi:chloramphenicol O-acetyltransferase type A
MDMAMFPPRVMVPCAAMAHEIDVSTWKRRDHFELFLRSEQPFFSVTVEVDVTDVWEHCKQSAETSFFLASNYLALRAINATDALRLRLRGERVWMHDRVGLGTPIMRPDETFGFARFDLGDSFDEFRSKGNAAIAHVQSGRVLDTMIEQDDLVYHTTLPWLRFTSFTNAIARPSSIPRLAFGKCVRQHARLVMPVAVEVHHALVDGLDVGRFVERFETELATYGNAIVG